MLPRIAGWSEWRSGNHTVMLPKSGGSSSVIRIDLRMTPTHSLGRVLADVLARDAPFVATTRGNARWFVTVEGEYGATVTVEGTIRGRASAHVVAVVFAEDFYNLYDARTSEPKGAATLAEVVQQLAHEHRLGLGVRPRRFYVQPPPRWHVVGGLDLDVAFFPPDYPRVTSVIQVWPALPIRANEPSAAEVIDREDDEAGLEIDRAKSVGPMRVAIPNLPSGNEWHRTRANANGLRVLRHIVELKDERYFYRFRLDTREHADVAAHRAVFRNVLESMKTIPTASAGPTADELVSLFGVD